MPVAGKVKKAKQSLLQPRGLAVGFTPFNLGHLRFPFCGEIGWLLTASSSAWPERNSGPLRWFGFEAAAISVGL